MENKLDERQKQKQNEVGNKSFWVMITVCLLLNFWDLFIGNSEYISSKGVSLGVFIGMTTYIILSIKEGLWLNHQLRGIRGSMLFSAMFSLIITIVYWGILIVQKQPGDSMPVNKMAGLAFLVLFGVSFLISYGLGLLNSHREKKMEEKYRDD